MILLKRFFAIWNAVAGLIFMGLSGCSGNGNADRIQAAAHGEAVYEMNCQARHEGKNLQLVKQPPSLVGLFQRSKLSSRAPATDEAVRKTIMEGRGIMPPFQQTLSKEDIDDLVEYLHTLSKQSQQGASTQAGHEISQP